MDSRVVSAQIKQRVWPELRRVGFSKFSERNAWRYDDGSIHVVNFQSFNSYLANQAHVTTFSFSVNLGVFFSCIPPSSGPPTFPKAGVPKPLEVDCHLRGQIERSIAQRELSRRDIWYVDDQGSYLELAISDAISALATRGLAWFKNYGHPRPALDLLLGEAVDTLEGEVWGFGNPGSPSRDYKAGYLALSMGRTDVAAIHLARAASYFHSNTQLADDVARCA